MTNTFCNIFTPNSACTEGLIRASDFDTRLALSQTSRMFRHACNFAATLESTTNQLAAAKYDSAKLSRAVAKFHGSANFRAGLMEAARIGAPRFARACLSKYLQLTDIQAAFAVAVIRGNFEVAKLGGMRQTSIGRALLQIARPDAHFEAGNILVQLYRVSRAMNMVVGNQHLPGLLYLAIVLGDEHLVKGLVASRCEMSAAEFTASIAEGLIATFEARKYVSWMHWLVPLSVLDAEYATSVVCAAACAGVDLRDRAQLSWTRVPDLTLTAIRTWQSDGRMDDKMFAHVVIWHCSRAHFDATEFIGQTAWVPEGTKLFPAASPSEYCAERGCAKRWTHHSPFCGSHRVLHRMLAARIAGDALYVTAATATDGLYHFEVEYRGTLFGPSVVMLGPGLVARFDSYRLMGVEVAASEVELAASEVELAASEVELP